MKFSRLLSALLLSSIVFPIAFYALPMPNIAGQVTGSISVNIGGSTSTSITSYTGGGGGGGGGGSTTTISATTTSFSTLNGSTTLTSASANVPEFRNGPILMISAIALALIFSRATKVLKVRDKQRKRPSH